MIKILLLICLAIYIVSMIEIVGSYYLTAKFQKIHWGINIKMGVFLPFLAPLIAYADYSNAREFYVKKPKYNKWHHPESFICYIVHGRKSIHEWFMEKTAANWKVR